MTTIFPSNRTKIIKKKKEKYIQKGNISSPSRQHCYPTPKISSLRGITTSESCGSHRKRFFVISGMEETFRVTKLRHSHRVYTSVDSTCPSRTFSNSNPPRISKCDWFAWRAILFQREDRLAYR